jgi:hypothetical protein
MEQSRLARLVVPVVLAAGLAATGAPPAIADETEAPAPEERVVEDPIRLHGVTWHRDLDGARDAAAGAERRRAKPVLLLRVLGDLEGLT